MAEIFLAFKNSPVEPMSEVRSTFILSGIQSVRAHGLFPRYSEMLSVADRERIMGLTGGIWVPVEVAVAHYAALDRLELDRTTIETIGTENASRAWKHTFAPIVARSKRIGPKPWESLSHAQETIQLSWRGGDVRILKEGPTRALFEWAGNPCAAIPYFVTSCGSFLRAIITLFTLRARYQVAPEQCSPTSIALRMSWVERVAEDLPWATPAGAPNSDTRLKTDEAPPAPRRKTVPSRP